MYTRQHLLFKICVQIKRAREVINKQDISGSSFLSPVKSEYINAFVFAYLIRVLPLLKGKGLPQQAEVAQGVPGRLRPRIFLTFGTTRVVGRQPYAPAAFTPGEIPGTHF